MQMQKTVIEFAFAIMKKTLMIKHPPPIFTLEDRHISCITTCKRFLLKMRQELVCFMKQLVEEEVATHAVEVATIAPRASV